MKEAKIQKLRAKAIVELLARGEEIAWSMGLGWSQQR
jgi:hypothetical protein